MSVTGIACQTSSCWLVSIDKHISSFVSINFELTINKNLDIIFSLHKFVLHYPLINFLNAVGVEKWQCQHEQTTRCERKICNEVWSTCLHNVNTSEWYTVSSHDNWPTCRKYKYLSCLARRQYLKNLSAAAAGWRHGLHVRRVLSWSERPLAVLTPCDLCSPQSWAS